MTRKEAQIRNHNIMRLKGIWASAQSLMDPTLASIVMHAIDCQLVKMGATTPMQDREKFRKAHNI